MYWTYILLCDNGAYYTGQTSRLAHRCVEHVAGTGARYTRAFPPLSILYYEALPTRSAALKREHEIKSLKRKEKERLVEQFRPTHSLVRLNCIIKQQETDP